MAIENTFNKYHKAGLFLMLGLLIATLVYLYAFYQENGDIIRRDISLTGGTSVTVYHPADVSELKTFLERDFEEVSIRETSDLRTGEQISVIIEVKESPEEIIPALEEFFSITLDESNSSIEFTGSTLGAEFYKQLRFAVILAFILMSGVVFVLFKNLIPSLAVILAAFANMAMTVAVVNLLGISVSGAGILAFLMLIDYSIDSNILLTTRVLKKREGTLNQRIYGAFKTGITMLVAAILGAIISLFLVSGFSEVLKQIFTIVLIGLCLDIFNTWVANVSMIKWYADRKGMQ